MLTLSKSVLFSCLNSFDAVSVHCEYCARLMFKTTVVANKYLETQTGGFIFVKLFNCDSMCVRVDVDTYRAYGLILQQSREPY